MKINRCDICGKDIDVKREPDMLEMLIDTEGGQTVSLASESLLWRETNGEMEIADFHVLCFLRLVRCISVIKMPGGETKIVYHGKNASTSGMRIRQKKEES